jgi:hypothetical protein
MPPPEFLPRFTSICISDGLDRGYDVIEWQLIERCGFHRPIQTEIDNPNVSGTPCKIDAVPVGSKHVAVGLSVRPPVSQ